MLWPERAAAIDTVGAKVAATGSYSSAELVTLQQPVVGVLDVCPPATRTFPVDRRTAGWSRRPVPIDPVEVKVPAAGSYNSAEARAPVQHPPEANAPPPAIRTLPLGRRVAVGSWRPAAIDPVKVKVPVAGSYSSAEVINPAPGLPAAMRTLPVGRRVAVWPQRP